VSSPNKARLRKNRFAILFLSRSGNYYQVNDGFSFSSSVDELSKYVAGKK
jgi:hypothetical protein